VLISSFEISLRFLVFGAFVYASYTHFSRETPEPLGMRLLRLTSLTAFILNMWVVLAIRDVQSFMATLISIVFVLIAGCVFVFALRASGSQNLNVAHSERNSDHLLLDGVFGRLRHPFYFSYLLFWWSWVVVTFHIASAAAAAVLTIQYLASVRREERILAEKFGEAYRLYAEKTPAFFPKLRL